jgi:uncharacterized protein YqhQ
MKFQSIIVELASLPLTLLHASKKPKKVGGQAVIEGVMMRGRHKVSWAVRNPKGSIVVEKSTFISAGAKNPFLRWPVLRGAVSLYESLVLGYKALARSAEIATDENGVASPATPDPGHAENAPPNPVPPAQKKKGIGETAASWSSFAFALLLSLGLFMFAPMWALSKIVPPDSAVMFNAFAGIVRVALFIAYLALISLWSEMRRIFEYHGAEHMAIFAFEDGKDLTLDNMRSYTTLHPRCGTSFLFLAMLMTIVLFSIIDALIITGFGPYPNVLVRFVVHIALIPLVAGSSYEILKLSDKYKQLPIVGALILPGLWLQKITTKKPDDRQLEVAAAALKAVL